jgi:hypothetical protein
MSVYAITLRIGCLFILLAVDPVIATEPPQLPVQTQAQVSIENGVYRLYSEVVIGRTPAQVYRVLSDFSQLPRINSGITAVKLLDFVDGSQRMIVEASSCVLLFCRTYRWVQSARKLADGSIQADIEDTSVDAVPSDFKYGQTLYRFLPYQGCTRLVFEAELEPKFWIPPFIGPWLIERKLVTEALETARSVEQHAGAESASQTPCQ